MILADPALSAVQHLVGPDAIDVLRLPVEAVGGNIHEARPVHVQFRPGSDVIVRYSASVSWQGNPPVRETLVASSTVRGIHEGAVVVTAETASGPIEVGVWRWPFDPILTGLGSAVSPSAAGKLLGLDPSHLSVHVVAYRPTERAVIKVASTADDSVHAYIKVVAPNTAGAIVERHDALLAAGVPVPPVTFADEPRGLLVLAPLPGPTLRQLIKGTPGRWPSSDELDRLADRFTAAELHMTPVAAKLADGALHARMLAVVLATQRDRLEALAQRFESAIRPEAHTTIHGDLHEAQLLVVDGCVSGVLDIDDAGPGAAVDDRANLLARLLFRALTGAANPAPIVAYAEALRSASTRRFGTSRLDVHTAACLVGLATGPFRVQSTGWPQAVERLVDHAHQLSMRKVSATPHRTLTATCAP